MTTDYGGVVERPIRPENTTPYRLQKIYTNIKQIHIIHETRYTHACSKSFLFILCYQMFFTLISKMFHRVCISDRYIK